ncbi:MAG: hypothetical protein MR867_05200 [Eubacterium sp.]|nr:hypothetical protein [Eubacterium sp.]
MGKGKNMNENLIVEDDTIYELDPECLKKKRCGERCLYDLQKNEEEDLQKNTRQKKYNKGRAR